MSEGSATGGIKQETLDALGQGFVEDVGRCVVPIFTDENGAPVSVGTGFLLDTKFGHALVTAAHVLEGLSDGRPFYFYVAPNLKRAIAGTALLSKLPPSGSRDDDLVDVAAVLLTGDPDGLPPYTAVGKLSLPLERIATQEVPRLGRRYAFLGFPASKGTVNRVDRGVRSGMYSYLASSSPPEVYARLGFDERFHIVLPFQKRDVITLDGAKFNFPGLKGMSGSPLWELRREEEGGRRVVGIMIRDKHKREHVVVAVDIHAVVLMLADHFRKIGLIAE